MLRIYKKLARPTLPYDIEPWTIRMIEERRMRFMRERYRYIVLGQRKKLLNCERAQRNLQKNKKTGKNTLSQ
jgi:hypothetical protein